MLKNKFILFIGVIGLLFCPAAVYADQFNVIFHVDNGQMYTDTTKNTPVPAGTGPVQVIKGSPDYPPKADKTPSHGSIATFGGAAPIVGQVGDGAMGAGGFEFGKSNVDVSNNDGFFVRYWTPDGNFYGQPSAVQKISWSNFPTPPYVLSYAPFAVYHAATPPTPTDVLKEITGYTANPVTLAPDKPIVTLTMDVKLDNYQVTKYEFKIQKFNPQTGENFGDAVIVGASGKVLQDKDNFNLNASYKIQARAKNLFNADPAWGPAVPVQLDIGGIASGTINVDYTLSAGLNQFALFVDPDKGDFKVNDQSLSNSLDNFIQNIKAKNPAVELNTFGWWDSAAKKPVGYIILWEGLTPAYKAVNGAPDATKTKLIKDKVYQVAVGDTFIFTISGTR